MPPLTNQQASQELYTQNYKPWTTQYGRVSNAPNGCSQISIQTANYLRNTWVPGSSQNTWNQSMRTGYTTNDGITRWVTRSVSGGSEVVDFHAYWSGVTFLWHFRLV